MFEAWSDEKQTSFQEQASKMNGMETRLDVLVDEEEIEEVRRGVEDF